MAKVALQNIRHVAGFLRQNEEQLRASGLMRALVLNQIKAGEQPSTEDLAAALEEAPPSAAQVGGSRLTPDEVRELLEAPPADPTAWVRARMTPERQHEAIENGYRRIQADTALLCRYVARYYVRQHPRRTGPRRGSARSLREDTRIAREYFEAAIANEKRRQPKSRKFIQEAVAKDNGISRSTLMNILRDWRAKVS
ncbi:MAG: hypothetical protein AB7H96_12800 [Vicinamibacterales bacterium]